MAARRASRRTVVIFEERRETLTFSQLCREAGVHGRTARRMIELGLAQPVDTRGGEERFGVEVVAVLARAERLRSDLALDHQGAVLACELLGRIERLESRLSRYERP